MKKAFSFFTKKNEDDNNNQDKKNNEKLTRTFSDPLFSLEERLRRQKTRIDQLEQGIKTLKNLNKELIEKFAEFAKDELPFKQYLMCKDFLIWLHTSDVCLWKAFMEVPEIYQESAKINFLMEYYPYQDIATNNSAELKTKQIGSNLYNSYIANNSIIPKETKEVKAMQEAKSALDAMKQNSELNEAKAIPHFSVMAFEVAIQFKATFTKTKLGKDVFTALEKTLDDAKTKTLTELDRANEAMKKTSEELAKLKAPKLNRANSYRL